MAKDNSSLYLPLKIDLNDWEKSLMEADADLQKAMKQMRGAVKDLKFRYDVDISSAKAAGDFTKAMELENRKLNQVYDTQKQALEALNRAYMESVRVKGKDAEETQKLGQQLNYQIKEVERAKKQLDAVSGNFGAKLSNALANVSPEFAKIRSVTANLTGELGKLGSVAVTAGKAIAGIAIPVALTGAAIGGIRKLVNSYKEIAVSSAEANEEVYQLREVLNSSYEEAELLAGAARIDGVNLKQLGASVNMLYKNIDAGNEKGKRALALLEQYDAKITDMNGNRKNTIDMFRELQNAYANAEAMGKGRDFLTGLFGGTSDEFLHFIKGFDYYIDGAQAVRAENERDYDSSHKLLDLRKQEAEALRQLAAVRGDAFVAGAVEAQQIHNAGLQEQIKLYEEAKEKLSGFSDEMRNLAVAEEGANLAFEKFKIALQIEGAKAFDTAWKGLKNIADEYSRLKELDNTPFKNTLYSALFGGADLLLGGIKKISGEEDKVTARESDNAELAELSAMEEAEKEKKRVQEQAARDEIARQKKEAEANKKTLEEQKKAQEQFYKELRDLRSDDYQKEINHLNDRRAAWEKANVDILDIEKRYSEEKAAIDKKYYEKKEKERQDNLKKEQEAYKKELEEAKKARESQISEAESTIKNSSKLLSYIKKQQESGTYNEEDAKKYADKLYLKSSGIKESQINTAYDIGIPKLKEILDSRNRFFGKFAGINTDNTITDSIGFRNNYQQMYQQQMQIPQAPKVEPQVSVTVNFDNVVVEDAGAIQRIADRVADTITPVVEQVLSGGASYGY